MTDNASNVPFEIAKLQAAQVLERMIAGKPLGHTGEDSQFITNPKVSIATSLGGSFDDLNGENVRIELSGKGVAEHLVRSKEILESVLQQLPGLKSHIKFGDADEEANNTRTILAELIDKGAEVPKELLKWAGFSHENNQKESYFGKAKHTTNITTTPIYGVNVHIHLPEHLNASMTMDSIKENLQSRKSEILAILADRVAKYKGVRGNKEEESKIRTVLSELEFEVHSTGDELVGEETRTGSLSIRIFSKQQKIAQGETKTLTDQDQTALEKTNILQTIKPLELSKAMSRAILSGDAKDMDVTMEIIGGIDVYRMLEKQLPKLKQQKPELAEKIDEVLASTLFKSDNYDVPKSKQHETKKKLGYEQVNSENKIIVDIPLPKDEAGRFIRDVAKMAPQVDTTQFATIDNVQLVGIHSPLPALHNELQKVAAPHVGKEVDGPDMDQFARNIVSLIEQAHQQVESAKKAVAVKPASSPVTPANWAQKLAAMAPSKQGSLGLGA